MGYGRLMMHSPSALLVLALAVFTTGACSSGGGSGDTTDTGSGSGTTDDTGGGTCALATSCLGAFFGACFDPAGTCSSTATTQSYTSGAKLTKSGSTWTAQSSSGATCYTVDDAGGSYTFHSGSATMTLTYAGNQARFVCPDGSPVNFTASSFANSECAHYVPAGCTKK